MSNPSFTDELVFEIFQNFMGYPKARQDLALNYARKYYSKISYNPKFYTLSMPILFKILEEDILVDDHKIVSESILKWLQHNEIEPALGLQMILSCVKLSLLSSRYIENRILSYASRVPNYCNKIIVNQQLYLNKLFIQRTANLNTVEAPPQNRSLNSIPDTKNINIIPTSNMSSIEQLFKKEICKIVFICYNETRSPIIHTFNFDKLSWETAILPDVNSECYKTTIVNKMLMIIGGIKSHQNTDHAYLIHMRTGSIMQISSLNYKRSEMGVAVIDTKSVKNVYAIGGWRTINDIKNTYREVERWNSLSQKWEIVAPMHHERACITPAVLNGKIYVAGGFGNDGRSFEKYDPETDKWTMLTPMKRRRRYCTLAAWKNKIFAIGGSSALNMKLLRYVEIYDPESDAWFPFADLPQPTRVYAFSTKNKLFCAGIDLSVPNLLEYDVQESKWIKCLSIIIPYNCFSINTYTDFE